MVVCLFLRLCTGTKWLVAILECQVLRHQDLFSPPAYTADTVYNVHAVNPLYVHYIYIQTQREKYIECSSSNANIVYNAHSTYCVQCTQSIHYLMYAGVALEHILDMVGNVHSLHSVRIVARSLVNDRILTAVLFFDEYYFAHCLCNLVQHVQYVFYVPYVQHVEYVQCAQYVRYAQLYNVLGTLYLIFCSWYLEPRTLCLVPSI